MNDVSTYWPEGSEHCAKQVVKATLIAPTGERFIGFNHIEQPQGHCPRAGMKSGEGYELCREVCRQPGHAEVNALRIAGEEAKGAVVYIEGHTFACDSCRSAMEEAGVAAHVIGAPPA